MKIAVNCWILRNKQIDGIGNFAIETLRPLILAHPEIHFQILVDKKFNEPYFDFPNVSLHRIFPALRHPVLYVWYMEIVLGAFLCKHKPELFLGIDGFLCLNASTRQLPVIYDLNFEHYPKDMPWRNSFYYRTFFKRFAKKANRIATISAYSKADIVKWYGVDAEKIDNVSCGIKENFTPLSQEKIQAVREAYSHGQPYLFFVGSMHPRKNIIRLIEAFDLFKKNTKSTHKLILAGNILWDDGMFDEVFTKTSFREDIIFAGRVSDDDLKLLLGAAEILTYVPIFEGFGLPIVEAFQAEVPVICSNVTSMPEVAGDAALLVNPFDVQEIAEAIQTLTADADMQKTLVEKGRVRKQNFSWQKTADLLYESIQKTLI